MVLSTFFCVGVLLLETSFSYSAESISTIRIDLYIDLYFFRKSYFFVRFRFIGYPLYFILILSSGLMGDCNEKCIVHSAEGISFPGLPTLARKIANHNIAPCVFSHLIGLFFNNNTGNLLAARETIFLSQSVPIVCVLNHMNVNP